MGVGLWAILGTIYLVILTWQDHKDNMQVDERRNYFMIGLTFGLLFVFKSSFWILLLLALGTGLITVLIAASKIFGEADLQAIGWMVMGFGINQLLAAVTMLMWLAGCWAVYSMAALFIFKLPKTQKVPFFGVLLVAFVANCLLWGAYQW